MNRRRLRELGSAAICGFAGLLFALALVPSNAYAWQQKSGTGSKKELVLDYDFDGEALLEVASVDSDKGTIQIRSVDGYQFPAAFTEGHYFLLPDFPKDEQPAESPSIYRAHVLEIGDNGQILMEVGKEAAEQINPGDKFRSLVRPEGATTKQILAFPNVINEDKSAQEYKKRLQEIRKFMTQATGSVGNLKKIGEALIKYEKEQGYFPPAIVNGPDGRPWHSWRVLLLPYLGQKDLYEAYDMSKPWNDPQNLTILDRIPDVYRDPIYQDKSSWYTHYVVLTGDKTAFRPEGIRLPSPEILKRSKKPFYELSLEQRKGLVISTRIQDNAALTIAAASVGPTQKILWTKPEDITSASAEVKPGQTGGFSAPYTFEDTKIAPVLMFDGTVKMLRDTVDTESLAAMMTIAGGETLDKDKIPLIDMPSIFKGRKSLVLKNASAGASYMVDERKTSAVAKRGLDSAVFPVKFDGESEQP